MKYYKSLNTFLLPLTYIIILLNCHFRLSETFPIFAFFRSKINLNVTHESVTYIYVCSYISHPSLPFLFLLHQLSPPLSYFFHFRLVLFKAQSFPASVLSHTDFQFSNLLCYFNPITLNFYCNLIYLIKIKSGW